MRFALSFLLSLATLSVPTHAETMITDFGDFFDDGLHASWRDPFAVIENGPSSYTVTATGFGSNQTYIADFGILGAGNTHLQLDIILSGPTAADGQLEPAITLSDVDGTTKFFSWPGQTLGIHSLTMPISAAVITSPGTTPGLDLNNLQFLGMEMRTGLFGSSGAYTAAWDNLSLAVPESSSMALLSLMMIAATTRRGSRLSRLATSSPAMLSK